MNPGLYERGHIPGAANVSWHTDLVDTVSRDIAPPAQFQALLARAGIDADTTTILYGDNNNWFAAWGAWVFDIYGIQNVKLLDGGRKNGRPRAAAGQQRHRARAGQRPRQDANRRCARGCRTCWPWRVRKARRAGRYPLGRRIQRQDLRAQRRAELAVRAGHVPGAVNVTWSKLVAEDGTFKSAEELKAIYQAAGVDGSKPVITYCHMASAPAIPGSR